MTEPAHFRDLLSGLQSRAAARIDRLETELDNLARARRDGSDDDEHDPEGVPLSAEWSRLVGLLQAARSEAAEVDSALIRLEAGSCGICSQCRKAIPVERLEARPFADRCVRCAS